MLTYKGLRYNGADQAFVKKIMDDLEEAVRRLDRLEKQSKTQTKVKE